MNPPTIAIIGRGNVATHLNNALSPYADVLMVNPHTLEGMPAHPDITLISVSDSAIREVAEKLSVKDCGILAHTSGSTSMDVLTGMARETGVFYPLQTFSKDVALNYAEIPFFIEASSIEAEGTLTSLARNVSPNVYHAGSDRRRGLHIASVFACNFVNHMWSIADSLLYEQDLDISVLRPLIQETFRKAMANPPHTVQTGPAVRGDLNTINKHLDMLDDKPAIRKLYEEISMSIHNEACPKLSED